MGKFAVTTLDGHEDNRDVADVELNNVVQLNEELSEDQREIFHAVLRPVI